MDREYRSRWSEVSNAPRFVETWTGREPTTNFEYDNNGSTTKESVGRTTTSYSWDGAKRLKEVKLNGSTQASFTHDGTGARTSKTAGGATTSYVNDTRSLTTVLQETKAGNTLSYVPGLTQFDPSKSGAAQWSYFHADAKDNRALTNRNAVVTQRSEYDPFGQLRTQSGSGSSDFGYADEQRDPETGLLNLRARYYDPALGRFLSRDSLSGTTGAPQSFNRYSYALNNPVGLVDPSGHVPTFAPGFDPGPKPTVFNDIKPRMSPEQMLYWYYQPLPDSLHKELQNRLFGYKPEQDNKAGRAADCSNTGQYTGSCPGGPPNFECRNDGEEQTKK